jgi:iron complex transport system ATP-binding protein
VSWRCERLTFAYPGVAGPAVDGVSLSIREGACTAVLGPNGSGKSTLLRLMLGVLSPDAGAVEFERRPLASWPRAELARRVGVVPQSEEIAFPLTVRELVAMGRYPHLGPWRSEGEADRRAIAGAMRVCDVEGLAERAVSTLSGGERQRARIARALAQEPRVLALDEPTIALDVRHEMEIFELLRELGASGVTVLLITHNLNLAARYADRLALLDRGRLAAAGAPAEVIRRELLERVYAWPVRVAEHDGAPQVVPLSGRPGAGLPDDIHTR